MSEDLDTSASSELSHKLNPMLSRRAALRIGGIGATGALLAACGSGRNSTGSTPKINTSATTSTEDIDFIKTTFGGGTTNAGAGLAYPFAAGLLLSTSQAPYGQSSLKGINLAIKQIKAAGGPDLAPNIKDFAASTTAGANAMRQWGGAKLPFAITCGFFAQGNVIAPGQQYKVLMTDPGGGDIKAFQGKPYVWGTRAITPNDTYAGTVQYLAAKMPNIKKVVVAGADIGPIGTAAVDVLKEALSKYLPGASVVGEVYTAASSSGAYDWSSAVSKIQRLNPDAIFPFTWGTDPASFMKALSSAGVKAAVIGPDFDPGSVDLAASAMDGYMFAYDYFDAKNPGNPWGQKFVAQYEAAYGETPDYYPANYYENTYFLWQLIQRTLAAGGNPKSGTDLQTALAKDPKLMSVYGVGDTTGSIELSAETHTVTGRPCGLFQYSTKTKSVNQLASFGIGGIDFKAL
ncbi:MAG: amino acid/amide transporter substrate-binding protein family [Frankiales bacterium]|nr:amino acid/amide transporter substrate-binding protein family [Frankiales bacterium]